MFITLHVVSLFLPLHDFIRYFFSALLPPLNVDIYLGTKEKTAPKYIRLGLSLPFLSFVKINVKTYTKDLS